MKYYINRAKNRLLTDSTERTPYLIAKGYEEITKEEYESIEEEQFEQYKKEHPEEFEGEDDNEQD